MTKATSSESILRSLKLYFPFVYIINRLSKDNSCLGINWYERWGCIKIKIQIPRRFEMSRAELRHKHWDLIQLCVTTYLSQPLGNCWKSRNTCKRIQIQRLSNHIRLYRWKSNDTSTYTLTMWIRYDCDDNESLAVEIRVRLGVVALRSWQILLALLR